MLDLDGVVYRGDHAVDGAPDLLRRVREAGLRLAFVTNNAARTPDAVARQLRSLGIDAQAGDVVTSAQAAAREVAARVPAGSPVLVIGGEGLEVALRERDLVPVSGTAESPAAVVQGFHPDVGWRQLADGAYAVAGGLPWIATNVDRTIPTGEGIAPGNGTLVAVIEAVVGHPPDVVAGKPFRPLFDETLRRTGARHALVVGDRLDTDIEGANRCDADSLLVLTGVTDVAALCRAAAPQRPTYVAWGLDGLLGTHQLPVHDDGCWRVDDWTVRASAAAIRVDSAGGDRAAGLRAIVAASWAWYDAPGERSGDDRLDLGVAIDALRGG